MTAFKKRGLNNTTIYLDSKTVLILVSYFIGKITKISFEFNKKKLSRLFFEFN